MRSGTRLPGSGSARSARPARLRVARGPGPEASPRAGRAKGLPCDSRCGLQAVPPARLRKGARWGPCGHSPSSAPSLAPGACPTLASRPFRFAAWQAPLFRSSSASAPTAWPICEKAALPPPRTHLDALSCSRARDFWPPNRVLARNPPHLKGKECLRTTKAQVGRIGTGQSAPKERRSVPERGLVARNRRFPRTRDNRQSAPPSPFGKLGAPANPTSALGRPFRHLPAATRKGRSVRRGLPSSPFASRRGAAQRKAGGGARQGPFDGCASRRAQPLSRSACGSSCSAGAVSPPTLRVSGTVPAGHQAASSGRQTRLRSTPFRATTHAFHARTRPIGTLRGTAAAPVPSASAPPASLWP